MPEASLDLTALRCPMPLLKTKLALTKIDSGERLIVVVSDEGSLTDIPRWLAKAGHQLLELEKTPPIFKLTICKG